VKGNVVASKKVRRTIAISAFAVAAAAAPIIAATTLSSSAPQNQAYPGQCLAWFGNKEDGKCLGVSNGQPISGSTPWGMYGPSQNAGVSTGPVLPGQTISSPVN
jgi:hypothetical protein